MTDICLINQSQFTIWDNYVKRHPQSSPYHLIAWRKAVENAYGHQAFYWAAFEDGEIVGILPTIRIKSIMSNGSLTALPFCDVGGCLAENAAIKQALVNQAIAYTKDNAIPVFDHRVSDKAQQVNPEDSHAKVRMIMPFPQTSAQLWNGFKSKLRSQIRKAEKNGLIATLGRDQQHVDGFYQVFCKNMRDLGSPVHSKAWFEKLVDAYQDNLIIANIYTGDTVIGAGIVLFNGTSACIPWASTNSEFNKLAPNMLLYWKLLEFSNDRGATEFDFGRSSFGEGTFKFKTQWGAEPRALIWEKYNALGELLQSEATNKSKTRDIVESTWRKMPLAVCNMLGPIVRKYISL